jgi:hypothetical protein
MIEEQLREALHELADEVPAGRVPPLRLPYRATRRSSAGNGDGRRYSPYTRWLAPLAAAASVLVIAAGIAYVAGIIRPGGQQPSTNTLVPGTVPPYYVALTTEGSPYAAHLYGAGIYATATGAMIASVSAPGKARTFVGVSAAANDLTFAAAAEAYPATGLPAVTFYLIRFDPASRSVILSPVAQQRVPAGASLAGFALSPNADRLAVAFEPRGSARGSTAELRVLTISTGAVRTWTSSRGSVAAGTVSPPVSWADNNATLAFNWYGSRRGHPGGFMPTTGVRLLDTRGRGGDLVATSHLAVRLYHVKNHPDPSGLVPDAGLLTADGKVVVAAAWSPLDGSGGFAEFSSVTGHMIRKLGWGLTGTSAPTNSMAVLWSSRSGRTLVASSPPGHPGQIAIITGARLRLLPWPAHVPFPAAAW